MNKQYYKPCRECKGLGKIKLPIGKSARRRYARRLKNFEQGTEGIKKPKQLVPHVDKCSYCKGTGLVLSENFPQINTNYPNVAIIGGGIGGFALAVACLHRGIPYTLYERDESFDARSQGYGLTLQQASKAMEGLGIFRLENSLISTMHIVHDTSGKIIGEWGRRKLSEQELQKITKPRNIHISRQALRSQLREQLRDDKNILWGHCLKNIHHDSTLGTQLEFQVGDTTHISQADLVVGADGIRSSVRSLAIGEKKSPLNYLGCIVILGTCSLDKLCDRQNPLLDSETVFQTVNGHERIYMMPYDTNNIMWQFSFPIAEQNAKTLNKKGSTALKHETIQRLRAWHSPIPEIIQFTDTSRISGYPVYDREILSPKILKNLGNTTLLGDAMHPMSPFKGQGANQAILDALDLARSITTTCDGDSQWREKGLREVLLEDFEKEMLERSTHKVRDSARAVKLLHSDAVLHNGDIPRGRGIE